MSQSVIGLYSSVPQSGKSTIADCLAVRGFFASVSFASPIKQLVIELLIGLGYERHDARALARVHKERVIPELGVSSRYLQQKLATEYGRNMVHPDIWIMCAEATIRKLLSQGHSVVIDDVRFENEAELIKRLGGELWMVKRPSAICEARHESDGRLDDWDGFDRTIINDGSIEDLHRLIIKTIGC